MTATRFTANQCLTQRSAVFGDEMVSAAMLERRRHHIQTLVIRGDSGRMRKPRVSGRWSLALDAQQAPDENDNGRRGGQDGWR
jgi:hypothetical protein